ncbi:MAG: hypothetical protein AB1758_30720 [Candidatus Eremiobacterota bacterium]
MDALCNRLYSAWQGCLTNDAGEGSVHTAAWTQLRELSAAWGVGMLDADEVLRLLQELEQYLAREVEVFQSLQPLDLETYELGRRAVLDGLALLAQVTARLLATPPDGWSTSFDALEPLATEGDEAIRLGRELLEEAARLTR